MPHKYRQKRNHSDDLSDAGSGAKFPPVERNSSGAARDPFLLGAKRAGTVPVAPVRTTGSAGNSSTSNGSGDGFLIDGNSTPSKLAAAEGQGARGASGAGPFGAAGHPGYARSKTGGGIVGSGSGSGSGGIDPVVGEFLGQSEDSPSAGTGSKSGGLKGIKLDFKNFNALKRGIDLIIRLDIQKYVPGVWFNADVCKGPGVPDPLISVIDGTRFIVECSKVPGCVLSLGWLTSDKTSLSYGKAYTDAMIQSMLDIVMMPLISDGLGMLGTP